MTDQETIKTLTDDLSYHKREVHLLKSEKETLQSVLTMKTADVKDSLQSELKKIEANFVTVNDILAKYRTADGGFENYEKLTEADRNALKAPVTTLAQVSGDQQTALEGQLLPSPVVVNISSSATSTGPMPACGA